jgi:hypothetical protein
MKGYVEEDSQEIDANIPLRSMRDRLFKIHKDLAKYSKEMQSFHKTLSERMKQPGKQPEDQQDISVMEAAMKQMKAATIQIDQAYNWVSFLNDYVPISDG